MMYIIYFLMVQEKSIYPPFIHMYRFKSEVLKNKHPGPEVPAAASLKKLNVIKCLQLVNIGEGYMMGIHCTIFNFSIGLKFPKIKG